jgi:hypothetical protein
MTTIKTGKITNAKNKAITNRIIIDSIKCPDNNPMSIIRIHTH